MAVDGAGNLYVPDFSNHRVLRYNSPFTSDTIADDVWGQADFTGRECNRGRGLGAPDNQSLCFASPYFGTSVGVGIDAAGNLWVADIANHRVLRFPFDPATGSPRHEADLVLGQPDFTSFTPGPGLHQMWSPSAVRVDGAGSVYVAEYSDGAPEGENNRVLIFDPPLLSGQTARKLDYPFYRPESLEFDPAGNLWVNDSHNTQLLLFVGGVVQRVLLKDLPASDRRCGSDNTTGDRPPFHFEGNGGTDFYSWNLCGVGGSIGVDSDGNVFLTAPIRRTSGGSQSPSRCRQRASRIRRTPGSSSRTSGQFRTKWVWRGSSASAAWPWRRVSSSSPTTGGCSSGTTLPI